MIKKIITRIKTLWQKIKEKIFGKPLTREEIFEGLFQHVLKTDPMYLTITCICGNKLTFRDLETKFAKDYVHFLYYCKRDNITTEKRYNYLLEEIKD